MPSQTATVQLTDNPTPPNPTASPSHPAPVHYDLLTAWLLDPIFSFEQWALSQGGKESSMRVKKSMWGKFCRWMGKQNIPLDYCTAKNIEGFFKEESITKEQRYRYIFLIETIYFHLRSIGLTLNKNPGQEASFARLGTGLNDDMRFFSEQERELILKGLRAVWGNQKEKKDEKENRWQIIRDAALIGVIWGGGLRVMEAGDLSVNCTLDNGGVIIEALGEVAEHQVELLPIGIEALAVWQPRRARLVGYGDKLFPPDAIRRRDDVVAPIKMDPSNIYRRVRTMLEDFGLTGTRISPQTLRNTYAAIRIEQGWTDPVIMANMGLIEDTTVPHMRLDHRTWRLGNSEKT